MSNKKDLKKTRSKAFPYELYRFPKKKASSEYRNEHEHVEYICDVAPLGYSIPTHNIINRQ